MPNSLFHLSELAARASTYSLWLHVDIMDGVFAPNPLWKNLNEIADAKFPSDISLEVHLMTENPASLGALCAKAGAKRVMAHVEAFADTSEAIAALDVWREAGAKEVGLAIKVDTPLSVLEPLAAQCDFLQVMSIGEIGYQGKQFDEHAITRVEELHAMYPDMMVGVDGGISEATVETLVRAGANRLVVGGAIAQSSDPARAYADIHTRAMRGCMPVSGMQKAESNVA